MDIYNFTLKSMVKGIARRLVEEQVLGDVRVVSAPSLDTFKKVEEMSMSCFPKSNPLPTFFFHLRKEIEAAVGQAAKLPDKPAISGFILKGLTVNGNKMPPGPV